MFNRLLAPSFAALVLLAVPGNAEESEKLLFNRSVLVCDENGYREYEPDANHEPISEPDPKIENPSPVQGPSTVTVEEPVDISIEPETKDNDEPKERRAIFNDLGAQWVMAFGTLGILCFTGVGLWYIAKTLDEAKRATKAADQTVDASRDAVDETRKIGINQTRAYVFQREFEIIRQTASDQFVGLEIYLEWFNGGNTPALLVTSTVNVLYQRFLFPKTFDYADAKTIELSAPLSIGPRQMMASKKMSFDAADLRDIWNNQGEALIWSWIEYNDVFPSTPRRRTENCVKFVVFADPDRNSDCFRLEMFGPFNGNDETCMKETRTEKNGIVRK